MFLLPLTLLLLAITLGWYSLGKYNENYWKARGVKFYNKNKVLGPYWDFLVSRRALFELFSELYKKHRDQPVVGVGQLTTPALFVVNPKNVQHVLSGDFQAFHHRGFESLDGDKLSDSIIFMNGPRWKLMRQSMTPLFTASKLKNMYYIMDKCAQDFVTFLKNNPKTWEGDFHSTLMMFNNAAVCGAIFGIGTESIFDSPFLKMAKKMSNTNFINQLKFVFFILNPKLAGMMGIKLFKQYEDFFIESINTVMKKREQEGVKKHDFADIALSIQKNGTMKDRATGYEMEPTTALLSAQALFFFTAGVEPCANAMFSTLTLLCRHPEILEKVHQEIDEHFEKHKNNITYDVINEMEYVDKVISEGMRRFPPTGFLTRQCCQDTELPVGKVKVAKGTKMFTPIYDIHNDPQIYPNPDVFDPERFCKETRPGDDIYMPFGMGNRTCIGARYAKLQIVAGMVHVLRNFTVKSPDVNVKIKFAHDPVNVKLDNVDVQLVPRKGIFK